MVAWSWLQALLLSVFFCVSRSTPKSTSQSRKLMAIFHPGPGKTGTTHFQSFLVKYENVLLAHNYAIWPDLYPAFKKCKNEGTLSTGDVMFRLKVKQLSFYYKFFDRCNYIQNTIRAFIQESAQQNRSVIFSSETFLASPAGVMNIMDMLLAENYQIHGLITYRFYINWFISRYGEHIETHSITSKGAGHGKHVDSAQLSDYVKQFWGVYSQPHSIDEFYKILSTYPDFRLSIIDLYGIAAAKKEFEDVVLCEIGGVLCGDSLLGGGDRNITSHESESAMKKIQRQMTFLFHEYAVRSNCSMDITGRSHGRTLEFLTSVMSTWDPDSLPCPLTQVNLSLQTDLSLAIDLDLRSRYGQYFVHGNPAANSLKATTISAQMEPDYAALSTRNDTCRQAMRSHLARAKKAGVCKK